MDDLIRDMEFKGLVSFECSNWLQRAIESKNPRLTVFLAYSRQLPLTQDGLGKVLSLVSPNETNIINWN